jgi:DNA-binding NarL/FixJ family response regulator
MLSACSAPVTYFPPPPLRVLIVDAHDIFRLACPALLRTQGFAVAGLTPNDDVVAVGRTFEPHVALIDPEPVGQFRNIVLGLRSLARAPLVVVMSSAEPERLDPLSRGLPFLAKADVCAPAIRHAVESAGDESAAQAESG